ncbi:hypothetical protein BH10PSE15_BH10PSE15_12240 [soil metagenome]
MSAPASLPKPLKLIKVGNSTGVILPKDVLAKLGVAAGDSLDLSDVPGGVTITRHDDGSRHRWKPHGR